MLTSADILCLLAALVAGIAYYFHRSFAYWKNRGVPFIKPEFPFGNVGNPIKPTKPLSSYISALYDTLKLRGEKHGGLYLAVSPIYVPIHPDYVRNIMITDFNHFVDRGTYVNEKDDPLTANLFGIRGQKWRNLRAKLTPTFTSGKMKMMFQIMVASSSNMLEFIDKSIAEKKGVLDAKDVFASFTTDIIGSAAFGLNCNTFTDKDSKFLLYSRKIFKPTTMDQVRGFFCFTFPNFARAIGLHLFDKEACEFFMDVIHKAVDYREKNKENRKDFLQLLMDLKETELGGLTFNEIAAQSFLFFLAGFETSSTAMTFALYEMCLNEDIQQKAREEVNQVLAKHNGEITYDSVMEMKYLQQVIDESMRLYPSLPVINRICTEPYKVPGTDVTIEKDTFVFIPVHSLHHDPEFYPYPEKFDPDRFSEENKKNHVNYTYLPFGDGPRNCIGLRFGLMQAKMGLAQLLRNYSMTVNVRTRTPIEIDPTSFVISTKDKIWLNAKKISSRDTW